MPGVRYSTLHVSYVYGIVERRVTLALYGDFEVRNKLSLAHRNPRQRSNTRSCDLVPGAGQDDGGHDQGCVRALPQAEQHI